MQLRFEADAQTFAYLERRLDTIIRLMPRNRPENISCQWS